MTLYHSTGTILKMWPFTVTYSFLYISTDCGFSGTSKFTTII